MISSGSETFRAWLFENRQTRIGTSVAGLAEDGATMDSSAPRPKLLDRFRTEIRLRHYSPRTEEAYAGWIRRYVLYHGKRHPSEMGETEIAGFLSHLAEGLHVSAATQNQALNALVFCIEKYSIYPSAVCDHSCVRNVRPICRLC
jgi:hypothetical protein